MKLIKKLRLFVSTFLEFSFRRRLQLAHITFLFCVCIDSISNLRERASKLMELMEISFLEEEEMLSFLIAALSVCPTCTTQRKPKEPKSNSPNFHSLSLWRETSSKATLSKLLGQRQRLLFDYSSISLNEFYSFFFLQIFHEYDSQRR